MDIHTTARHCDVSDTLRQHVADQLGKLDKYHPKLNEAHVIFSQEKFRHEAEIIVIGKDLRTTAKAQTEDQVGAFQKAFERIRRQLTDDQKQRRLRKRRLAKQISARRKDEAA